MFEVRKDNDIFEGTMEPISGAKISEILVAKGFSFFLSRVSKLLTGPTEKSTAAAPEVPRFNEHYERTFQHCTKIKTLLNRDEPVEMLHQYVNTTFEIRSGEKRVIEDYDLITEIEERRRAVISGTGGGGKTIFMRYLWLALTVKQTKRIPVFIELRRLNPLTNSNLQSFVFHEIISSGGDGERYFEEALSKGRFVFIFDGFDELAADKRGFIESQILDLSTKFDRNIFVVSTRPDDRFQSWQEFTTYHVRPLELKQVELLVERVNFPLEIKRRFIEKLRSGMFELHQSFLSTPLLATMMLLTFQHYADIPEKMHVFYDHAFQTLYSKHDALKEAFSRQKYTDYSIDVFRKRLACLSVITYYDEKFEFSEAEILEYIKKSAAIDTSEIDAELFFKDLVESVCILQIEGFTITFSHRSFQEYFAALYLTQCPTERLKLLLPKLARRISDSVVSMFADMNRDLFEEAYILPTIDKLQASLHAARSLTWRPKLPKLTHFASE